MKEHMIFDAVGQLPDRFLEEAAPRPKKRPAYLRWGLAAACLCLVITAAVFGVRSYGTVVAYVSIDVNPSIELGLNCWNRVLDVTAYNADAQAVCGTLELEHMTYSDALDTLLNSSKFCSYLGENADLTVTIVSHDADDLRSATEECDSYVKHSGQLYCSDFSTLDEAHHNDCSVGKYAAYQELADCDSSVSLDDCRDMTMHEIYTRIDACHGGSHHAASSAGQGTGADNHHETDGHHAEPSEHCEPVAPAATTATAPTACEETAAPAHHDEPETVCPTEQQSSSHHRDRHHRNHR